MLTYTESRIQEWKEYFENHHNPINSHYEEETELEDFGLSITWVMVAGAVKKLCSRSALGADEIRPKLLKALNVVGLS